MSDILLASLSDPESAAIDMIIRRNWPNLKTLRIRRNASLSIPHQTEHARKCKYCILDLFSVGLKTCSPESKARLQGFLAGRPPFLSVLRVRRVGLKQSLIQTYWQSTNLIRVRNCSRR